MPITLSWLTAAAARASRTNRCRAAPLPASAGSRTLRATTRCSFSSNARRTIPIPPSPTTSSTSWCPSRPSAPRAAEGARKSSATVSATPERCSAAGRSRTGSGRSWARKSASSRWRRAGPATQASSRNAARSAGVGFSRAARNRSRTRFDSSATGAPPAGLQSHATEPAEMSQKIRPGSPGRGVLPADLAPEPGPGVAPQPVRAGPGQAEALGSVLDRQASEEVQLHDAGGLGVLGGKPGQGLVEGEDLLGRRADRDVLVVELDPLPVPAVPEAALAAGRFDEDAAHGLGGGGEELTPAGPPGPHRPGLAGEPQVGLVDQVGRLEGVARALAGQAVGGQPPQFVVDEREEVGGGLAVTGRGGLEQLSQLRHGSQFVVDGRRGPGGPGQYTPPGRPRNRKSGHPGGPKCCPRDRNVARVGHIDRATRAIRAICSGIYERGPWVRRSGSP